MEILEVIRTAWGWLGIKPRQVLEINSFGNVLFEDDAGKYWRICPENLSCEVIAESKERYNDLRLDPNFRNDWEMNNLVLIARKKLGNLKEGQCYCLVTPAVLGGAYAAENIATIPVLEAIGLSGDVAEQIKDLPDGTKVKISLVD